MSQKYTILLYYKYVRIDEPQAFRDAHFELCKRLGLKGRIIIATEGINGTCEGTDEACQEYMQIMKADARFSDIHWKVSLGTPDGKAFPRLSVKVRKEIVSLHLGDEDEDIDPNQITGIHLKPEELRKWYEEGREFHIVDMRNGYELEVGKFEGTVFPELDNFRDLKKNLKKIEDLKDKTVLTVCTGGVRCEKASGLLVREGFNDVYQLDGGMVTYMEKYPGQDFKGSLYVFDQRLTLNFTDPAKHEIIGKCKKCGSKSEHYVNCSNNNCHEHFICCIDCLEENPPNHPSGGVAYCDIWCKTKDKINKFKKALV
ncbi:MAG: rhodanese-related sulfurtransferase [Candidatus Nomurabacteria bacterium]|nr:rhodanese-related sulfurtransferase [Candidatus Nomurabacteria bacterium]